MPPSGYNSKQSGFIMSFLSSCAQSLKSEGLSNGQTPIEILNKECVSIRTYLENTGRDDFASITLSLTLAFYDQLIKLNPTSYDSIEELVNGLLEKVKSEITSVHVDTYSNDPLETV